MNFPPEQKDYIIKILQDTLDRCIRERDLYLKIVIEARAILKAGDLEKLKEQLNRVLEA